MKLFIPTVGTKLKLTSEWNFTLRQESRNNKFLTAIGWAETGGYRSRTHPKIDLTAFPLELVREYGAPSVLVEEIKNYYGAAPSFQYEYLYPMKLPVDTVLQMDRIYIRKGMGTFDSVTFLISDCPDKRFAPKKARGFLPGGCRFWVKLEEANMVECDVVG